MKYSISLRFYTLGECSIIIICREVHYKIIYSILPHIFKHPLCQTGGKKFKNSFIMNEFSFLVVLKQEANPLLSTYGNMKTRVK